MIKNINTKEIDFSQFVLWIFYTSSHNRDEQPVVYLHFILSILLLNSNFFRKTNGYSRFYFIHI